MNTQSEVAGTSFAAILQDKPVREAGLAAEPSILLAYLQILARRKWTLVICVALALLLALILTLVATREYTASSELEIARDKDRVFEVEGQTTQSTLADAAFYETQYNLLRSRSLADRVVRDLGLRQSAAFADAFGLDRAGKEDGASAPFVSGDNGAAGAADSDRQRAIREVLLTHLSIDPVRNSQLVRISFTSPDPQLSAKIAQSWAENFIAEQIERKMGESSFARKYLEKRLTTLRNALERTERQSVEFANQKGIVSIQSESPDGKAVGGRLLAEDTVADLNKALNQAVSERMAAEAAYRAGSRADTSDSVVLTSPVLSPLRARRAELAADYQRLLTQFDPQYPAAQALQRQIQELGDQIAVEERRIKGNLTQNLRASYTAALDREQGLRARMAAMQQDLTKTKRDNIEYNILRRDADQNRQLYDAVLQRYMEIGVAGGVGPTNISIVDNAEVPVSPSAPSPALNMLLALALGLGLGIAVIVAQEQLDDAIKDPGDLERQLHLPSLGIVPTAEVDDYQHFMGELKDPKSAFSEAILAIQASLSFASPEGIPRSMAFTSTQPSEGKSVTSTAVASWLAMGGYRTLLIDADMRSPSLNELLQLPNARGLSSALSGEEDLENLVQKTSWSKLDVMLAGPQPPNAAELLGSYRLSDLLKRVSDRYDKVVIDAPPVIGLADSLLISSAVSATIYVVAASQTSANRARIALRRLRGSDANIVGAVLTKYDPKGTFGYGYGYDYGYGYGHEKA
jgi:capsular exopolysaccharide synthesis family protein